MYTYSVTFAAVLQRILQNIVNNMLHMVLFVQRQVLSLIIVIYFYAKTNVNFRNI